jgi:hypothetical protein
MGRLDLPDKLRDEDSERPRPQLVSANELARTFDCRVRQCERTAESDRGRYAYLCSVHRAEKVEGDRALRRSSQPDLYAGKVRELLVLAKKLDRVRAKALPIARELGEAKAEFQRAVAELPV